MTTTTRSNVTAHETFNDLLSSSPSGTQLRQAGAMRDVVVTRRLAHEPAPAPSGPRVARKPIGPKR